MTLQTIAKYAVVVAVAKFALEGVTFGEFNAGHTDSMLYAMFLTPILGHDYLINLQKLKSGVDSNDDKT